jgi:hypothetical protein
MNESIIEGCMPCGRPFVIRNRWSETLAPIGSSLEYCPWGGVGSITIPIRYGGSGNVFHELRTKGKVSEETRRAVFLT